MVKIQKILILSVIMSVATLESVRFACAHEKRTVAGKYEFVVGFINEPAFSGQMNGVDLRVSTAGSFSKPVEELEEKLKVTVSSPMSEGASIAPVLRTRYKDPGRYGAYFMPTRVGQYIFQIQGEIDGEKVDEVFKSGEGFHDVEDSATLRFPQEGQ